MGVVAAVLASVAGANAAEELSEKSVKVVMDTAWGMMPNQYTQSDGETILIDKKKRDEILVPIDVAREVIRVGYRSAQAQACKLKEEEIKNYKSLMRRESDKKKWTKQQLLYIHQLHFATLSLTIGRLKYTGDENGKEVTVLEREAKTTCPPELATKTKAEIDAYVASGPALPPSETAATAAPGPAPAAPVPAPKK